MDSKYNPNGSENAIEGITSKNGQIIGKMGHQNVSKTVSSKIFQEIKTNTSLRQRLNTLLENNRVPRYSVMIFFRYAVVIKSLKT